MDERHLQVPLLRRPVRRRWLRHGHRDLAVEHEPLRRDLAVRRGAARPSAAAARLQLAVGARAA